MFKLRLSILVLLFPVSNVVAQVTSPRTLHRRGQTDFKRKEEIRYATTNGIRVIRYGKGYPWGGFEPGLSR